MYYHLVGRTENKRPAIAASERFNFGCYLFKMLYFLTLGDGQSSNSSGQTTTHSKDRSQADGSSLDLEWEHEDGTGVTDQVSFIIKSPSSH